FVLLILKNIFGEGPEQSLLQGLQVGQRGRRHAERLFHGIGAWDFGPSRAEVIIPVFEEVVFFHLVQQDGWRSIGFGKNKAVQRRGDDQFGGGDLIDEVLPVVGQRREHRISHFYVFVDRFPVGDNDEVRSD